MLSQQEADDLLALLKCLDDLNKPINFPKFGEHISLNATDKSEHRYNFNIDVNRKGTISVSKCTYQTRIDSVILLRLDVGGPNHTNPDLSVVPCPHLHIYREGSRDKWAYPLERHIVTNTDDLIQVLRDFLEYNNINDEDRPEIRGSGGIL